MPIKQATLNKMQELDKMIMDFSNIMAELPIGSGVWVGIHEAQKKLIEAKYWTFNANAFMLQKEQAEIKDADTPLNEEVKTGSN